ncbi:MAG: transposase [Proteobacteria bacterium]|nr:transposase [Pseudomonadota bacterium]
MPQRRASRDCAERLSRLAGGRLLYRLKHGWRDGATHVVFTPQELVGKLAALVPTPRFDLVRYHGVLGPCASERDRVVPTGLTARRVQSAPSPEPGVVVDLILGQQPA